MAQSTEKRFFLGNHRLGHELAICGADLEAKLEAFERDGKTAVVLCSATSPMLILAVADTIRETSVEAIERMTRMGARQLAARRQARYDQRSDRQARICRHGGRRNK